MAFVSELTLEKLAGTIQKFEISFDPGKAKIGKRPAECHKLGQTPLKVFQKQHP